MKSSLPLLRQTAVAACVLVAAQFSAAPAAELPHLTSVSQYGITWTFDRPTPVGKFVNGDFYVVGPVKVVGINPPPLRGSEVPADQIDDSEKKRFPNANYIRNGSMLNPPA